MNITIIGEGAFGVALGKILTENGHSIVYFDREKSLTLAEATEGAEALVIAIPAEEVAGLVSILPEKLKQLPVILGSKGLLSIDMFADFTQFAVLAGASFAEDMAAGLPVKLTVSSELAAQLFANAQVSVELTDDALGVVLCGSLKNIYAIGAGCLCVTRDEILSYLQTALMEMRLYLADHGAKPETADLACGISDLTMTTTSEKSRNLRFGQALVAGRSVAEAREELGTVAGLATLAEVDREGYPIITKIYELVVKNEI